MDCLSNILTSEFILILLISMILGMYLSYSIEIYSPIKIAFLVILIMIVLQMLLPLLNEENFVSYELNNNCDFTNRVSDSDYCIEEDQSSLIEYSDKHLKRSHSHYPELSQKQINYKDCTNYFSGNKSCLIPNPIDNMRKIVPEKSLLVSGIENNKDLNTIFREDLNYYKDFVF